MTTPATYNLKAIRYYDFAHIFSFDYDITYLDFYSEIRNSKKEKVAEFHIVKGIGDITMILSETVLAGITDGTYYYDVKQVTESGFQTQIIVGTIAISSGHTQAP